MPGSEAPERVTVLDVLATPAADPSPAPSAADGAGADDEGLPAMAATPEELRTGDTDAVPEADELPITDYDSLAASQVVPRLATMSRPDLELVGAYERSHRNRQTILHRVAQLLAQ